MPTLTAAIHTLAFADLKYYSEQWPLNAAATAAQLACWPRTTDLFERWPTDHPDTLRLLAADGGDSEPVLHIQKRAFRACGWDGANHRFLDDLDLVRIGRFLHLGTERTLLLIMKAQCERQYADTPEATASASLLTALQTPDYREFAAYQGHWARRGRGFRNLGQQGRMDMATLYQTLRYYQLSNGYDDSDLFESLFQDARRYGLFLLPPEALEITRFITDKEAEMGKRAAASATARQRHWVARHHLRVCEYDLETRLWEQDQQRFEIEKVRVRYAIALGKAEIRRLEALLERERLSREIALKQANPDLSQAEIAEQVQQALTEVMDSLDQQRDLLGRGLGSQVAGRGGLGTIGTPIPPDQEATYRQECRRLISELRRLTHPDGEPLARQFTDNQRNALDAFFQRIMAISREELNLGNRSLEHLHAIKAQVLALYQQEGLRIPLDTPPNGTLEEITVWLEQRAERVKADINAVRDEMHHASADPTYQEQIGVLASADTIAQALAVLTEAAEAVEAELPPLRAQHAAIFGA